MPEFLRRRWSLNAAAFGDQVALMDPHRKQAPMTYRCGSLPQARCLGDHMPQMHTWLSRLGVPRPRRQLNKVITEFAAGLKALGLQQGEKVRRPGAFGVHQQSTSRRRIS